MALTCGGFSGICTITGLLNLKVYLFNRGVMIECAAAQQATGLNGRFHGGELKIFFSKLACWLHSPLMLVFVFDGNEKPKIKRGTQVISKGLWWEEISKELITLCGYYWVQVFCSIPRTAVQAI